MPIAPAEPNLDASSTPPASAVQPGPEAEAPPPSSSPQPITVTVPAHTAVSVRTIDRINSGTDHAEEFFRASLDAPIVVDDRVVALVGAIAGGSTGAAIDAASSRHALDISKAPKR